MFMDRVKDFDRHKCMSLSMSELNFIVDDGYIPVVDAVSELPVSNDFEPRETLYGGEEVYDSKQVDTWINHCSDYDWRGISHNPGRILEDIVLGVLDYWNLIEVQGEVNERSKNVFTEFTAEEFDREEAMDKYESLKQVRNNLNYDNGENVDNVLD
jgi:hypothetical protein